MREKSLMVECSVEWSMIRDGRVDLLFTSGGLGFLLVSEA